MKNIFRLIIAFAGLSLLSCTDDVIDRDNVSGNSAPVLKSPTALELVLNKDNAADLATTFVWDYAKYNGTNTVVNYSIEFDSAGNNFQSPTVVATTTDKFKNFTVGELNQAALDAGFAPFVLNNIEVRIKSTVGTTGTAVSQVSNFFTIKLTPYPSWPNWGILGSATPTGWSTDTNMNYDLNTKLYSITIHLTAGGVFKFRLDDSWSMNFGDDGNNLTLDQNGADIPVTVTGDYKITVNFGDALSSPVAFPAKSYTITLL